ncbi:sigma-54-dependent Fis family transcriptional regulator [candidate division KSB1 bacterium]|nr:sigma-54-dependent Fis family transcriptional regulator [candidate division KSB1 bacterium]
MHTVLLVDDENEILRDRSRIIEGLGYKCCVAQNGKEAIHLTQNEKPDIVLTDMRMPNFDGLNLLRAVQEIDHSIAVIVFTGYGTIESAVRAIKLGAFDYIQKPVSPEMMEILLRRAVEYRKLHFECTTASYKSETICQLENVTGKSNVILKIQERVLKVAQSDANVFIYGESGTGKESIARNIHAHSRRRDNAFIPLDCVALPESLLESELFGYEQGAFTGAAKSKPGVMELADGGTLFLDEIVELAPPLQAKLLRALQEHQFRRIGGTKIIDVNLRIISATNIEPRKAVEDKRLRQDLYYRLNVVPIYMPPLRERKEDIPLLVQQFIKKFNPSSPKEIKGITADAMKCLKQYDWPGNVRELQNIIEQAMSLTDHDMIYMQDLPEYIITNKNIPAEICCHGLNYKSARKKYLDQFNKNYFANLLRKHDGNMSRVAREAGISRRTLYRLLNDQGK